LLFSAFCVVYFRIRCLSPKYFRLVFSTIFTTARLGRFRRARKRLKFYVQVTTNPLLLAWSARN